MVGVAVLAGALGSVIGVGGQAPTPRLLKAAGASPVRPAKADVGGLQVSPLRVSVPDGQPGSLTTFTVTNTTDHVQTVSTSEVERSATGTTLPDSSTSASHWVAVVPVRATIQAGASRDFVVRTTVPARREPGERRIGVVFAGGGPTGSGLSFPVAIGTSVYVAGPGRVVHAIKLGRLTIPRAAQDGPVTFSIPVTNVGNVHVDLLTVESSPVGTSSGGGSFSFDQGTVLPGETGVLRGVWHDPPSLCWCQIAVATTDGHGGIRTVRAKVLVLSRTVATVGVAVLALLGALAMVARRRSSRPDGGERGTLPR